MKIIHRIGISRSSPIRDEIERLGFELEEGFDVLKIEEGNGKWDKVQQLLEDFEASDFVSTTFSKGEISAASHLEMQPSWHHGYPQPEARFGYRSTTYDDSNACPICWCGLVQKAPFNLHKPKWGRRSILQVNWVFDEYFVHPEVWEAVLKPLGITSREVCHSRSGETLDDILQIDIPQTPIGHCMDDLPYEVCESCGAKKFLPVTRGFFPALQEKCDLPIFKTREYFGSGGSAFHAVVVSQEVSEAIRNHKLKGVSFYPLKERSE